MKRLIASSLVALGLMAGSVQAANFTMDTEMAHSSIQFRIKHLGYSWLYGRFNKFDGTFSYDAAKPEDTKVSVKVQTTSVDSNHAERDKHIRGKDFFDVEAFPEATFESTGYKAGEKGTGTLEGNLTFHGVTKPISIAVTEIGAGDDPWGGYRQGFLGTATFALADYGIAYDLGPASKEVELILSVEGIKQK